MNETIIGVLGLGIFGRTIAKELSQYDKEVIAIDLDEEKVNWIADEVTTAAIGDFTDYTLLEKIGISNCETVVIATGTNLESSILAVMHCKKLGVNQIIVKANATTHAEALYALGATQVISPEKETGIRVASRLLSHHIMDILSLDDDNEIIEFSVPTQWIGKSILELDLRRQFHLNIIGIRQKKGEKLQITLDIHHPLQEGASLIAISNSQKFIELDYLDRLL